jgi:hypothetical protein
MKRLLATCVIAVCMLAVRADAQAPNTNAALRYWMAFAVTRDPPADRATAELLDRVAAGTSPWDEAKLGKILDANREALEIMQRATKLTSCDWGLEYELGPTTPIAHLAKARALGRLNGIAGTRLASRGQWVQAVDVWLAGVRFSQHVAHDGTLIALLSARLSLSPSLKSLVRAASQPTLDAAHRQQIAAVVRAIPDTGFDWADAMRREAEVIVVARRLDPSLNGKNLMPSQTMVDKTAADVRAERKAVLDAVTK